jgi:hypothetical protein
MYASISAFMLGFPSAGQSEVSQAAGSGQPVDQSQSATQAGGGGGGALQQSVAAQVSAAQTVAAGIFVLSGALPEQSKSAPQAGQSTAAQTISAADLSAVQEASSAASAPSLPMQVTALAIVAPSKQAVAVQAGKSAEAPHAKVTALGGAVSAQGAPVGSVCAKFGDAKASVIVVRSPALQVDASIAQRQALTSPPSCSQAVHWSATQHGALPYMHKSPASIKGWKQASGSPAMMHPRHVSERSSRFPTCIISPWTMGASDSRHGTISGAVQPAQQCVPTSLSTALILKLL